MQSLAQRAGSAMPRLAPRGAARRSAVSVSAQQKATPVSRCARFLR
jgi:hypothetical protein